MLINLILFCFFMFILGIGMGKMKKERSQKSLPDQKASGERTADE